MWRSIILVGIGGGIGSIFRFLTTYFINRYCTSSFPYATLLVNVLGCLLIGALVGVFGRNIMPNDNLKFLLITGFCGGYTTFSTFSVENLQLIQSGNLVASILYTTFSVLLGLLSVWAAFTLTK